MLGRRFLPVVLLFASARASAMPVHGTVLLPAAPPFTRPEGRWRLENGRLPIGPPLVDPHADAVVVLDGAPSAPVSPTTVTVSLHGLRLDPRVTVIQVGGAVEFKNEDRVRHALYIERGTSMMPATPTEVGQSRRQVFSAEGEFHIRDREYPHIEGTVVVVSSPYVARLDARGRFKLDAPPGRYTLRLFFERAWVVSRPLILGPRTPEVTVEVPAGPGARP